MPECDSIEVVRVYETSPQRLWRAWTDPDEIVRWWGRRGWRAQRDSIVMDVRPEGEFTIVSETATGERMTNQGRYREVVEPERLAIVELDASGAERATSVVTFTDLGDGRTEMRLHSRIRGDSRLRERAAAGLESALERLGEWLSSDPDQPTNTRMRGTKMPDDKPMITGTDFIAIGTTDFDRAAEFYGETLGLPMSTRWGEMPAGEFETGDLTIAVMQSAAFGIEFAPHGHPIALRVDDVAASRAELEAKGVEFRGETIDSGVCYQAIFTDPDGNVLDLHQRYAPPS